MCQMLSFPLPCSHLSLMPALCCGELFSVLSQSGTLLTDHGGKSFFHLGSRLQEMWGERCPAFRNPLSGVMRRPQRPVLCVLGLLGSQVMSADICCNPMRSLQAKNSWQGWVRRSGLSSIHSLGNALLKCFVKGESPCKGHVVRINTLMYSSFKS